MALIHDGRFMNNVTIHRKGLFMLDDYNDNTRIHDLSRTACVRNLFLILIAFIKYNHPNSCLSQCMYYHKNVKIIFNSIIIVTSTILVKFNI